MKYRPPLNDTDVTRLFAGTYDYALTNDEIDENAPFTDADRTLVWTAATWRDHREIVGRLYDRVRGPLCETPDEYRARRTPSRPTSGHDEPPRLFEV